MKLRLLKFWRGVGASYWFLPSIMVVSAAVLGALMIWLDAGPAAGLLDGLSWYQMSKPEGAREVLSVIAGSMVTVAGVVFSITIVAISFAASQYGPRILTNFMSDRGNQVTLGTFIATFVYSVVVLRTIHSGESSFVPQLAVFVALLLAFCSIGVLIYFIHHVPESIDVNSVTARIGRRLIASLAHRFPDSLGDPPQHSPSQEQQLARAAEDIFRDRGAVAEIPCPSDGYLQAIDTERLLAAAEEHDLVISVVLTPGNFVHRGAALALAAPASRVHRHTERSLQHSWVWGTDRTPGQDLIFLVDELVEISARALSPGVNDPYTAMTCLNWLSAAVAEVAGRQPPSAYRVDRDGRLRVVAPVATFDLYVDRGFGGIRPYAATDVNAAVHMFGRLRALASACCTSRQAEALADEADALFGQAQTELQGPSLERVKAEKASTSSALAERIAELGDDGSEEQARVERVRSVSA